MSNPDKERSKKILCEQIVLLAEVSKQCKPEELAELSNSMAKLYLAYLQSDCYQ